MENIIVFGGSDHARLVLDIIKNENKYNVIGIIDDFLEKNTIVFGYKVLGKLNELESILLSFKGVNSGIIAIGDNYTRHTFAEKIKKIKKFSFVSAIHPSTILGSNVKINDGCVISAGVIINNDTVIGEHCYLGMKVAISHDGKVDDFCSLAPGVTAGGNVNIGNLTAIGLGTNIIHGKNIGEQNVIGAGSLVVNNFENNLLVYGVPAKVIKKRKIDDPYL